jgi:hypothetical protein
MFSTKVSVGGLAVTLTMLTHHHGMRGKRGEKQKRNGDFSLHVLNHEATFP